ERVDLLGSTLPRNCMPPVEHGRTRRWPRQTRAATPTKTVSPASRWSDASLRHAVARLSPRMQSRSGSSVLDVDREVVAGQRILPREVNVPGALGAQPRESHSW